jgi:hypothetical protein
MKIDRRTFTNIFQGRVCNVCQDNTCNNFLDYVVYINNKRRAHSAALARNCCMNDNPRKTLKGAMSRDEYFFKVLKFETIAGQWALADKSMIGASGLSDGDIETGGPIPLSGKTFLSLSAIDIFKFLLPSL